MVSRIGSLSANEADLLLKELEKLEVNESWYDLADFSISAVHRLIELQGLEAVRSLEDHRYPKFMEQYGDDFALPMISFWTNQDPAAARDWVLTETSLAMADRGTLSVQLNEAYVLEAFFLNYEKQRPGEAMALLAEARSEEVQEQFLGAALQARLQLAGDTVPVSGILDQGLSLQNVHGFRRLLENALEKDGDSAKLWAENLTSSAYRDPSLLTVGEALLHDSGTEEERAIAWLLSQEFDQQQSRHRRLEILRSRLDRQRGHEDFISPVDRVTIPGIPASPDFVYWENSGTPSVGDAAVSTNSIEAILNNPQRQSGPHFLSLPLLREIASSSYGGRFAEQIETEIRELGLGLHPRELPDQVPQE